MSASQSKKNSDSDGKLTIIIAAISILTIKGTAYFEISIAAIPVIADSTNKFNPSGGVMKPKPRVVSMKMLK